jgi:hypothetical protein
VHDENVPRRELDQGVHLDVDATEWRRSSLRLRSVQHSSRTDYLAHPAEPAAARRCAGVGRCPRVAPAKLVLPGIGRTGAFGGKWASDVTLYNLGFRGEGQPVLLAE